MHKQHYLDLFGPIWSYYVLFINQNQLTHLVADLFSDAQLSIMIYMVIQKS
jgi:hypothetical protein